MQACRVRECVYVYVYLRITFAGLAVRLESESDWTAAAHPC